MTYGPPPGNSGGFPPHEPGGQQPGGYQPPQQPGYQSAFGAPGGKKSVASALLAPSSTNRALRVTGIVLALAALMIVLFSFFSWASSSDDGATVSINGIGSVSVDLGDTTSELDGVEGFEMPSTSELEKELEKDTSAPGIYTIVIGVLIAVAAVTLIINRFPGIGAVAGAVLALIAVIMALIFIADPGGAVVSGDAGDTSDVDAGWGLWLVTVGAFVALIAAGLSTYLALTSKPATPSAPGRGQPNNPGYQNPGQNPGYQNPGYQNPGQNPGYQNPGQNPGYQNPGQNPGYQNPGYQNPGGQQPGPYGQ